MLNAENFFEYLFTQGILPGVLGIGLFILLIVILKVVIRVTTPDNIIIVNGRKIQRHDKKFGFTVEKGRTHVLPYVEEAQYLDLGVLPINVRVEGVNSANGITVGADATACVCIDDDNPAMLYSAVEKLLGKTRKEIHEQIQQTLIGNFRGALNKTTPQQAIGMVDIKNDDEKPGHDESERAVFRSELLKDINSDLSSFGMKVVSVSLQKIWDTSNYIANLAQKTLAMKRQQVEIEESRLRAAAQNIESDSSKRMIVAKNRADEKIIKAKQKLEMYRRESTGQISQCSLDAKNAISQAMNSGLKDIQEKKVELMKLKNFSEVILEADADNKASEILALGQGQSIRIKEDAKNSILKQKLDILDKSEDIAKMILFLKQIPHLFNSFEEFAKHLNVDSLVIMDDKHGFNGAVNRGPAAFGDFIQKFKDALGVDVKDLLTVKAEVNKEAR